MQCGRLTLKCMYIYHERRLAIDETSRCEGLKRTEGDTGGRGVGSGSRVTCAHASIIA